jgi:hypothetical protein
MEKEGKLRVLIGLFFILILGISFVYGYQTLSSHFKDDFSKIKLLKEKNISLGNLYPVITADYLDETTNSKFKVQIIEFDNEDKLDSWIKGKIEKSFKKEKVDGHFIYIDEYKNYVFWKSGLKNFVQITAIRYDKITTEAIRNNFKTEGKGLFPQELIDDYISLYPSDCINEECLTENKRIAEKIKKDLKEYLINNKNPENLNNYEDKEETCPVNDEKLLEIQTRYSLNDEGVQTLKKQCETNGYFIIKGKKISSELKQCGKNVDLYLQSNGIIIYDDEETLSECLLRQDFLNNHRDYSQDQNSAFINERNQFILRDVKDQIELEDKRSANINSQIEKSILEKYEKRNLVHGFSQEPNKKSTIDEKLNKRPEDMIYWFEK